MPLKMIYRPNSFDKGIEVDVYHFHQNSETLECFVTCWVHQGKYWLTVPLHMIEPIDTRAPLNE